jgi:hypothetical protein
MNNAVLIDPRDSVAVVLKPVRKNEAVFFTLRGETREITALEDIPIYHKMAVESLWRAPLGGAIASSGGQDPKGM